MHYYCNICLVPLDSKDTQICANKKCCWQLTGKGTKSYFVEIQVVQQLQALLKKKGFYELLQHRFSRTKTNDIRDIYDGSIYKSLAENDGILSSPDNVSFLTNSDGAPVFKSSKVSIWL